MNSAIANKHILITATEWFGGGRRVPYDPNHHRILTASDALSTPHLMVFERVVGAPDARDAAGRWITMLPGYPDGSYGYAKVNALLGGELMPVPRLYVEYVGQVSGRLLRYYEEIGLLSPESTDPQTGYRYYSAGQLPRLNRILVLKELGLEAAPLPWPRQSQHIQSP